ncbi:hypothetical protein OBV_27300 [Oscillibacter valericigenes Sjm18-20]|nr:hypothetical protein OBV_27300 [Oscillibacter valericigenes Sjm18-20]
MAETSIVFKANDQISGSMKSMLGNSKALSKQFEDLQRKTQQLSQKNDAFNKSFAEISTQAVSAKKALKESVEAFKKTGDEESRLNFENAKKQYKDLTDAAKSYEEASKDTRKAIRETREDMRKLGDSSGGSGTSGGNSPDDMVSGLGSGLLKAGLIRDLGNSFAGLTGTLIESAVGQPLATTVNETLSGAASGAAAGALLGPGGIAVGAAMGGLSGFVNSANQIYQKQDDAFKDYYKNLYETGESATAESLSSGTTIAGSREQTQMAFAQRFGSDEAATEYLDKTREMAKDTNYTFDEITGYSKKLLNSYDPDAVFGVLKSLSDASAGLDLTSSDVDQFISGLSKMRTTNKATQEYLNYFSERGVDVYQALSDATGANKSKIADMITGGKISGEGAAKAILDYINQNYGGLSDKLAGTYDAMVDNLGDVMDEIKAAGGMGYTEERKSSVDADLSAYGGALGNELSKLSDVTGRVQAYGENLKDQFQREALSAVLLGQKTSAFTPEDAKKLEDLRSQYQEAEDAWNGGSMEAGQKMTDLKEEAESLATAAFESSDWSEKLHDAELDQINATRELTTGLSAATNALEVSNAFTKGQAASKGKFDPDTMNAGNYNPITDSWDNYEGSHAFGLRRVSKTGLYLLHQDETVKTAAESRAGSGDGGVHVEITGPVTVRKDSDLDEIAERLYQKIRMAQMRAGG